jgi:HlyD family type I secretion membrane fusion protein
MSNRTIDMPRSYARVVTIGGATAAVFVAFLVAFMFMPLDGAVIAGGLIQADMANKTVQHRDGGIVKRIRVREGARVQEGELLVELENDEIAAEVRVLDQKVTGLEIERIRFAAERDNLPRLNYPEWLMEKVRNEVGLKSFMHTQVQQFDAVRQSINSQISVERAKAQQNRLNIRGKREQVTAFKKQEDSVDEDLEMTKELARQGLKPAVKVREVERQKIEMLRRQAEMTAEISRLEESIVEIEARIVQIAKSRQAEVAEELRRISDQLNQFEPQLAAKTAVLQRTHILAPASGRVFDQKIFTEGGVVRPGEKIFDIVPDKAELIIEARVSPLDADEIEVGDPVRVKFGSTSRRHEEPMIGEVRYVAADQIQDQRTGEQFFKVLVAVNADPALPSLQLGPGMPMQVFFLTGSRSVMRYLFEPLIVNFGRALKEPGLGSAGRAS